MASRSKSQRNVKRSVPKTIDPKELEKNDLLKKIGNLQEEKRRRLSGEQIIINTIKQLWKTDPPSLYSLPPRPKVVKSARKADEVAVLFLSDIHYGKETSTYNSEQCKHRLNLLVDEVIKYTRLRRNIVNINEIHVLMGGDMIEGETIFPHQPHEIDKTVLDQAVKEGPAIFVNILIRLLQEFAKVKVVCVPGNHGRVGSKHSTNHPSTNWDRVFYEFVRVAMVGCAGHERRDELAKRFTFHHPETFYAVDQIGDWGILLVHGDQIKGSFAGFPWYGVAKKANGWKDSLRDIQSIPVSWDFLLFGHFHTPNFGVLNERFWFANGSTESDNQFAAEVMSSAGRAMQWLFYFDPKKGLTNQQMIFLEPIKSDLQRAKIKSGLRVE